MFFARFFFSQMTTPAVHYDVIYLPIPVNSQYFKTWEVDSPYPFNLWTNECHKIDTRLTENMRSRQNVPGRSKMASKSWNLLAYRTVTTSCPVLKKTQIVCVLLRRNATSAWNTFNVRLTAAKIGFPLWNFRMSKHSSEKEKRKNLLF